MIGGLTAPADAIAVRRGEWLAAVAVLGVAITWGVSFAVIKALVGDVTPSRLVGWRFVVATLTLIALRPRVLHELDRRTVGRGAALGALLGGGFVLCTLGMQTTSVLISAFVVGTTVVFTPLIAWIWLRRPLTARDAVATLLALAGLAMITIRSVAVEAGTLLILTAAIIWAVHLVALTQWSRRGRLYGLTVVQLAASAVLALGCQAVVNDWQGLWPPTSGSAAAGIIFLGTTATALAFIALSWAQTRLNATTTAVILTLEPLVGAGLGVALGDTWTAATAAGAIAVLTAVFLAAPIGGGIIRRITRPGPRGLMRYLRSSSDPTPPLVDLGNKTEVEAVRMLGDLGGGEAHCAGTPLWSNHAATQHNDGYPIVLVNLDEIDHDELRELITDSWLVKAPPKRRREYEAQ
jgi:drug/metabolite transporter (DMT)-like permease